MPSGLLWQLRPSDVEVELLAHTRNVVSKDLEQETGLHTGWIQNGGLFIASNKQRLDEYKRLMSVRHSSYPRVQRSGMSHEPEGIPQPGILFVPVQRVKAGRRHVEKSAFRLSHGSDLETLTQPHRRF